MDQKAIIKSCKEIGCCNACCLRYLGLKNPTAYENSKEFINEYLDGGKDSGVSDIGDTAQAGSGAAGDDTEGVPAKKAKTEDVCVSCIGVLQEESWPPCLQMLKEMLDKKRYECDRFACALSAPVATLLREKAIMALLAERHASYEDGCVTPLKEAWKWSVGEALERHCGKTLESGAVAPLLVTLHLEYPHEAAELEALRALAPREAGAGRGRGRGRERAGDAGMTRRAAERALESATAESLRATGWLPPPAPPTRVHPVSVACAHTPIYFGGRYVKLSRSLPQTPWVARGERIMPGSVQEIIFEPLAKLYGMAGAEAEHRLKFMSAGREDVDVRCLGTGRPFAVEVADPCRTPTAEELQQVCEQISSGGQLVVRSLVPVSRERLADLKRGEESKSKTYEALCIKLTDGAVTDQDLQRVGSWAGSVVQRTPLRVLHRRALAARARGLRAEGARAVPAHPRLFTLRLRTDAGTYVKEWAHGDLRRTAPPLAAALLAPADILALDVTHVHLDWP